MSGTKNDDAGTSNPSQPPTLSVADREATIADAVAAERARLTRVMKEVIDTDMRAKLEQTFMDGARAGTEKAVASMGELCGRQAARIVELEKRLAAGGSDWQEALTVLRHLLDLYDQRLSLRERPEVWEKARTLADRERTWAGA